MRSTLARIVTTAMVGAVALVAAPAAPAAAAYPTCTTGTLVTLATAHLNYRMLLPSAAGNIFCTLRVGDRGGAVVILQIHLNTCYDQNIAEDGIYGSDTWQAVANAQTWERVYYRRTVATDGTYGPQTVANMAYKTDFFGTCIRLDRTTH